MNVLMINFRLFYSNISYEQSVISVTRDSKSMMLLQVWIFKSGKTKNWWHDLTVLFVFTLLCENTDLSIRVGLESRTDRWWPFSGVQELVIQWNKQLWEIIVDKEFIDNAVNLSPFFNTGYFWLLGGAV